MKYTFIVFASFVFAGKSLPVEENQGLSVWSADELSYEKCGRLPDDRYSSTEFVSGGHLQQNRLAYPWSAAIVRVKNETHHDIHCHGSLITLDVVLSAGHCYKNKAMISELFIVLGSLEPLKAGITVDVKRGINYIYEIKEVMVHKDYQLNKKEAYYDVSLTLLKEKVRTDGNYPQYIHPICLPIRAEDENAARETERSRNSQQAIVTGYITDNPDTTGKLNYIRPIIQTQATCDQKFSDFRGFDFRDIIYSALPRNFTPALLCASIENSEQGTCRGDSGGPLFRYEFYNGSLSEKRYVQIGVVHGSVISCSPRFPGIYARLEEPSILEFVKSIGRNNSRTVYTALENVDCRWSLWSECGENLMQSRRITRLLEKNGKDCEDKTVTTRSCERQEKFFTCSSGATIPQEWVCDEMEDCRDKSDEINCPAGDPILTVTAIATPPLSTTATTTSTTSTTSTATGKEGICKYNCESDGSCDVTFIKTSGTGSGKCVGSCNGSCFGPDFGKGKCGGRCDGTPTYCTDCNCKCKGKAGSQFEEEV